ncbi:PLP-dependent transferase [Xylaria intraflava]|nr:PLP-dependent transferase [Xylaria intraflava]
MAKKHINLLRGWPATSLLPAAALRAASHTALSDPDIWMPGLEYGPDPGYQPLRDALARWLRRFYGPGTAGTAAETDRVTITGGASQSLACILQSFTDPAQTLAVWVVAPCYYLGSPILADAGFAGRLFPVPEDEEGVDVDFLDREMCALEAAAAEKPGFKDVGPHRKVYRHVVYCVPTFGNPSGRTMTLARREGVVRLARRHDALLICDDVYDMLQWHTGDPSLLSTEVDLDKALLPRLVDIDIAQGRSVHDPAGKHFGHAVSNGSFSKLVAPGVRTGWTYSTADFAYGVSQTGSTRSGGAASQLAATIVCQLLLTTTSPSRERNQSIAKSEADGVEEAECLLDIHIRETLRPSYARRHALLARAIRAVLVPLGIRMHEGSLRGREDVYGGYFVWLMLPRQSTAETTTGTTTVVWPTAQAIADRCQADEDLMIGNGELFAVREGESNSELRFDNAIRLCFSFEDEEDIVDGIERLGRVVRRMLDEGPGDWVVVGKGVGHVDLAK